MEVAQVVLNFIYIFILGIKIVQQVLEVEDMVAGILLDRINDTNSSCTDLNLIYFSLFLGWFTLLEMFSILARPKSVMRM